jgi:hypothetical protein
VIVPALAAYKVVLHDRAGSDDTACSAPFRSGLRVRATQCVGYGEQAVLDGVLVGFWRLEPFADVRPWDTR